MLLNQNIELKEAEKLQSFIYDSACQKSINAALEKKRNVLVSVLNINNR